MENLDILQFLDKVSPLGVIGLLSYIIYTLVNKRNEKNIVKEIKDNHLHEIAVGLTRIEEKLDKMNDHLIWVRSRINGIRK